MNFNQFCEHLTPNILQQPKQVYLPSERPIQNNTCLDITSSDLQKQALRKSVSKDKKRKSKRHFEQLDSNAEETHKKLEKLASDLVSNKKRIRKQKRKNSSKTDQDDANSCNASSSSQEFSFEDQQDFAVCLKYNQLTNQQLCLRDNVLAISDSNVTGTIDSEMFLRDSSKHNNLAYPYTGLLSKHVQSVKGRPVFYFEVKFVGNIDPEQNDTKQKDFCVGLSTIDFCGSKIVGSNKESIGLCGDGKIHYNDNSNSMVALDVNKGELKFYKGFILGIGYIFKTKQVLFTANGKELRCVDLPLKLVNKLLYPAISLGSREIHKVEINLGLKRFMFNLDDFVQNKYYKQIHSEISDFQSYQNKIKALDQKGIKFQKIRQIEDYHQLIQNYLVAEGFSETLKEVFYDAENNQTIRNYCNMKQLQSMKLESTQSPDIEDIANLKPILTSQISLGDIPQASGQNVEKQINLGDQNLNGKSMQNGKSKETCANPITDEAFKQQCYQIELRKKIQIMVENNQIEEVSQILKTQFPSLWQSNKTIECSLLSIKFINHFKANEIQQAIEMLQKPPLNSNSLNCIYHRLSDPVPENVNIVSVDSDGAQITIMPTNLTQLFCHQPNKNQSRKIQSLDPLLSNQHVKRVASYIQEQIYHHLRAKTNCSQLAQIIKQSAMNINYGLNDFSKHKVFETNPLVKKKVQSNEQRQLQKSHFTNNIGINIKHFNPAEKVREEERQAQILNTQKDAERKLEEGVNQLRRREFEF